MSQGTPVLSVLFLPKMAAVYMKKRQVEWQLYSLSSMTIYLPSCGLFPVSLNSTKSLGEPVSRSHPPRSNATDSRDYLRSGFHKDKRYFSFLLKLCCRRSFGVLTHRAEGDLAHLRWVYPVALGRVSAWAEEDTNTLQHMLLDAQRPLFWLSKLHTPPPSLVPTLPC